MTRFIAVFIALLLLAVCPITAAAASDARISGDVSGDGGVNAADAAIVLRAASGDVSLDAGTSAIADATGDMKVGRSDAIAILLMSAGRIKSFGDLTVGDADTLLADRFLDKFSYQGAVSRRNSYRSGELSFSITKLSYAGAECHLVDIYTRHIESLRTEFGGGAYRKGLETVPEMAGRVSALLAVSGDQYPRVSGGPLVRNGVWYRDSLERSSDVCVLYRDGVMETFAAGKADVDALETRDVYQSWICGPRLLDDSGMPMNSFTCPLDFKLHAARAAIGYYEPGHYCLLLVDGTANAHSKGIMLEDLSALFYSLGCKAAYNLFGGSNALMCSAMEIVSTSAGDLRPVSDILYLAEPVMD